MNCTMYILHFDRPYWNNGRADCRHYIGYTTKPLDERLKAHKKGKGSKLVAYAKKQGIGFSLTYSETGYDRLGARLREIYWKHRGAKRACCKCIAGGNGK